MNTTLKDFPRTDLPEARHQQVRQMLVRQARSSSVRTARVRWVLPVAVGAVAAATVGTVALAGPDLGSGSDRVAPADRQITDDPTCETGPTFGEIDARSDGMRMLSADPGDLALEASWVNLERTGCYDEPTPLLVMARVADGGAIQAAVTVWADAPTPEWEAPDTIEPVTLRGTEGKALRGSDYVDLWWSEDGQDLRVSASGMDEATVLAALDELVLADGSATWEQPPGGVTPMTGWQLAEREPVEAVWYADWVEPGVTATDGDTGVRKMTLEVSTTETPWQAWLSTVAPHGRLVEIDGAPGFIGDNGDPTVNFLSWTVAPGVMAQLSGTVDGTPEGVVAFAETLEPIAVDDPRIRIPEWMLNPPTTEPAPDATSSAPDSTVVPPPTLPAGSGSSSP